VGDSKRLSLCEQYTCIARNEIHYSKNTANISRQELYHKISAAAVVPAYELEVSTLRLFHEIQKAKLQRNADCNHLAGEAVYVIKLLQQMPYRKQRLNIHSAFTRHCSIAFQMSSWTFLIFFTTVSTYYVSHCSCHYLHADVTHKNLSHTTVQFNLTEVLYLKLGYPSSQQPLPVPWLHLLMKTNVTSLVQSLLMEWQCQIAPPHVSGFH